MAVSVMAASRASSLRLFYYTFGYLMMYASEEEEKGRVRRGRGKERGRRKHGRMARGGHVLLKVSLGPTPLRPSTVLLPLWIPHDVRIRGGRQGKGEKRKRKGKGGGETWVYGKGWPCTTSRIPRA
jgi:hypothetical protein